MFFVLIVQPVGAVLQQGLAESFDTAQRGTQVVRNGIAERLELSIGRFNRTLLASEAFVENPQLLVCLAVAAERHFERGE
jgi:hypothetical protein